MTTKDVKGKKYLLDDLLPPELRPRRQVPGFTKDLWNLVILKLPREFSLAEVYRHLSAVSKDRPLSRDLEAQARGTLQALRDKGYIEFLDRGQYRRIKQEIEE